jgi:hypothetical protein
VRTSRSLRDVARERLAVPLEWGNAMNLLVCASVVQPLAAWSGTPRTARNMEERTQYYGEAWKPDRSITQLYIPGLRELRPDDTRGLFINWAHVILPVTLQIVP